MSGSNTSAKSSSLSSVLFWGIYGQLAAVMSAFSIVVFAQNFFDLGLKGIIQQLVDLWIHGVRPVLSGPFQYALNILPKELRIELSNLSKDYISVGVVMLFSFLRANNQFVSLKQGSDISFHWIRIVLLCFTAPLVFLYCVMTWPFFVVYSLIVVSVFFVNPSGEEIGPALNAAVLTIAPFLYFLLIFILNTML